MVGLEDPVRLTDLVNVPEPLADPDTDTDPVTELLTVWGEGDGLKVAKGVTLTLSDPEGELL
jgi:hypothetical protein